MGLLQRVSQALGVTTQHILEQDGVVGDFHGDAAMGFWGWPLAQPDAAARACHGGAGHSRRVRSGRRTVPAIRWPNFRIGIGIATGRAVAGKIGTVDQVKVTVFGPVVNLASRLEGMTKFIRAPILLDEETATLDSRTTAAVAGPGAAIGGRAAVRHGSIAGVSELLPPAAEFPLLTDEHVAELRSGARRAVRRRLERRL